MIILGVDPASIKNTGLAIYHSDDNSVVYTEALVFNSDHPGQRLFIFKNALQQVLGTYLPSLIAIEYSGGFGLSFVRKNLNEFVGVLKLIAFENRFEVKEFTPTHIKKVITGSGKATKKELRAALVKKNLTTEKNEHIIDAIALALVASLEKKDNNER